MFKRDDTTRHLRDDGCRSVQLDRGGIWIRNHYGPVTAAGGIPEMFLQRELAESLAAEIIAYYADLDAA